MSQMNTKSQSPKSKALQERKRVAADEGAKALAEYAADAIATRKNMARLRALRLARQDSIKSDAEPSAPGKPRKRVKASM